jgi:hypothetical protein
MAFFPSAPKDLKRQRRPDRLGRAHEQDVRESLRRVVWRSWHEASDGRPSPFCCTKKAIWVPPGWPFFRLHPRNRAFLVKFALEGPDMTSNRSKKVESNFYIRTCVALPISILDTICNITHGKCSVCTGLMHENLVFPIALPIHV